MTLSEIKTDFNLDSVIKVNEKRFINLAYKKSADYGSKSHLILHDGEQVISVEGDDPEMSVSLNESPTRLWQGKYLIYRFISFEYDDRPANLQFLKLDVETGQSELAFDCKSLDFMNAWSCDVSPCGEKLFISASPCEYVDASIGLIIDASGDRQKIDLSEVYYGPFDGSVSWGEEEYLVYMKDHSGEKTELTLDLKRKRITYEDIENL